MLLNKSWFGRKKNKDIINYEKKMTVNKGNIVNQNEIRKK